VTVHPVPALFGALVDMATPAATEEDPPPPTTVPLVHVAVRVTEFPDEVGPVAAVLTFVNVLGAPVVPCGPAAP